jgi:recombination protein U
MRQTYRKTPAKDPQRQYQGAVNKQMGKNFELVIDAALNHYAQRGTAFIQKTPEPMRPTKDLGGGKFIAHYDKQAQPDYKGVMKGGRGVVFEAKHTTGDRIEQSRVTDEQAANLDRYADMGAVCFILVGFSMRDFFAIPWAVFRDMKNRYGRKYATPDNLDDYKVSTGRYGQLLFLDESG